MQRLAYWRSGGCGKLPAGEILVSSHFPFCGAFATISLHILPAGFVRIRHYGILSAKSKKVTIPLIREQHPETIFHYLEPRILKHFDPKIYPCCGKAAMVIIESIPSRGPPDAISAHKAIAFAAVAAS